MRTTLTICMLALSSAAMAQGSDLGRLGCDMRLEVESATTAGGGDNAPLWLSANRYGLSSVETAWNYERVSLHRDMRNDSTRKWRLGYGANAAVMFGGEQTICLQEYYIEAGWKKLFLTAGAKQEPLTMGRDPRLTSGALTYGINSRPIPQIKVGADYFNFPWCKGWWQIKGHVSFGWKTDAAWQRSYLDDHHLLNKPERDSRRTEGTLYHEKCLYWKFGRMDVFPLEFEFGLQWCTEFGGTAYSFEGRGVSLSETVGGYHFDSGMKAYWHALVPGGVGATDGDRPNIEGNHIGSWNLALTFKKNGWLAKAYAERMFEDYSQLGTRYGISDHLFGLQLGFPQNPYISGFVLEHLNTREQSGAIYHDITNSVSDQMDGRDNYYNHSNYNGYQNYGMSMGSPLITSPLYNQAFGHDGVIRFYNNRVRAWHVGISGSPLAGLDWRLLMTFSRNWGTYSEPFADPTDQTYLMVEAGYGPRSWKGWSGRIAVGLDHGDMLGNNTGAQLTVIKTFNL